MGTWLQSLHGGSSRYRSLWSKGSKMDRLLDPRDGPADEHLHSILKRQTQGKVVECWQICDLLPGSQKIILQKIPDWTLPFGIISPHQLTQPFQLCSGFKEYHKQRSRNRLAHMDFYVPKTALQPQLLQYGGGQEWIKSQCVPFRSNWINCGLFDTYQVYLGWRGGRRQPNFHQFRYHL